MGLLRPIEDSVRLQNNDRRSENDELMELYGLISEAMEIGVVQINIHGHRGQVLYTVTSEQFPEPGILTLKVLSIPRDIISDIKLVLVEDVSQVEN